MVIERVNRPEPSQGAAPGDADRSRALVRFVMIESVGFVALLVFLFGFFTLEWFPGQPTPLLIGALVIFALYVLFALWVSGLLATFTDKANARR